MNSHARPEAERGFFTLLKRQQFRRHFQPSRVMLCLLPAPTPSGVNIITLCFTMYCSYKPPMMAFAIQQGSYSYELMERAEECVLAVPGERLARQVLECGLKSGRDMDKMSEFNFSPLPSQTISVPGISECIANLEGKIRSKVPTGDHRTAVVEVQRFSVNRSNEERCLLSVGPSHKGYVVLARHGIHRIGVVEAGRNQNRD